MLLLGFVDPRYFFRPKPQVRASGLFRTVFMLLMVLWKRGIPVV
jgi:hypothetical protein